MFHVDRGLFLTSPALGIDVRRRLPRCFVSHAHADHMARHELALCTRETGLLYQHRLGKHRRVREMRYGEPLDFGSVELTAYPAGHCLGSAMLLINDGKRRLLYTGDYKLGISATAARAELPKADILVMESTFGLPRYRLPDRGVAIGQLVELIRAAFAAGETPVLHTYALGKSQEVTRILSDHGIGVLQHPQIFAMSQIYEACGVELGDFACYAGRPLAEHVVVTHPKSYGKYHLAGLTNVVTIALTGWAVDAATRYRQQVDHAVPLSDHADFDELLETVERVQAEEIYCTHGPYEFVNLLRDAGYNAFPLVRPRQGRLPF